VPAAITRRSTSLNRSWLPRDHDPWTRTASADGSSARSHSAQAA
jgi:hypothetical protein